MLIGPVKAADWSDLGRGCHWLNLEWVSPMMPEGKVGLELGRFPIDS
jgi:hypothetical protein